MKQVFNRVSWHVRDTVIPAADRGAFQSIEHLLQLPAERVTLDSRSGVSRLSLHNNYYVKAFRGRGSRLVFWLRRSRYQRELRNLEYFRTLGLNTPDLVAFGYESQLCLLQRAVLVTAEVIDAVDLQQLVRSGDLYRQGIPAARRILRLVAEAARTLHADGFYHKDLKPRNILVRQKSGEPSLFFFDCPGGHRPVRFRLRRGIVRDLAHMEATLHSHVRRTDLLYMFKVYLGRDTLGADDKRLARDALSYHATRRMTLRRRRRRRKERHQKARY